MQTEKRSNGFHSVPTESQPGLLGPITTASSNRGEGVVMDIYLHDVGKIGMMSHPQEKALFVQIERYSQEMQRYSAKLSASIGEFELEEMDRLEPRIEALPEDQRDVAQRQAERMIHFQTRIIQLRHRIVKANLRLAICIAKKYQDKGLSLLDLIQEANTGLMNAVERFDYHRGVPFGAYASWWVQQAIVHALANQGRTIRLPAYMVETLRRVSRIREKFSQTHHREPNIEELSQLAGITPALTRKLPYFATQSVSIDKPLEIESSRTLTQVLVDTDAPSPEESTLQQQMRDEVGQAIARLPEREAQILRLRYGFEDGMSHSLQEIGEMLNLSRERIRQLEKRALETLRHPSHSERLREHLYA